MIFVVEIVFRKNANSFPDDVERRSDAYWARMADRGVLLGGGPWSDGSGRMLVCQAADQAVLLQVLNGDPLIGSRMVSRVRVRKWNPILGRRPGWEALTPHEERIARMMIDGMTNRTIAERLSVSTRAVELHITRIYRKLAIKRRAQLAVALARQPDAA